MFKCRNCSTSFTCRLGWLCKRSLIIGSGVFFFFKVLRHRHKAGLLLCYSDVYLSVLSKMTAFIWFFFFKCSFHKMLKLLISKNTFETIIGLNEICVSLVFNFAKKFFFSENLSKCSIRVTMKMHKSCFLVANCMSSFPLLYMVDDIPNGEALCISTKCLDEILHEVAVSKAALVKIFNSHVKVCEW